MAVSQKHRWLEDKPFEGKEIDVHQAQRANRLEFVSVNGAIDDLVIRN